MGIKLDIYLILYFLVLNFFLVNLSLNLYKVYDIFIVMFRFFGGYFMIWSLIKFNLYWKKDSKRDLFLNFVLI